MKRVGSVKNLKKKPGSQVIRRGKHLLVINKLNKNFKSKQ